MKTSIRWGAVCFFGLMLAMAACGSDDADPAPGNTGGSGGEGGQADPNPDAGSEPDAADDADSGDEPDAGDEPDSGDKPDGGDDDSCILCMKDATKCGSHYDACMATEACESAFGALRTCLEQASDEQAGQVCVDRFTTDGGQAAGDLVACAISECASDC